MRLSLLGGGSPFVLEFFLALARRPLPALDEILLLGRDAANLARVARFARGRGFAVGWTTDPDAACDGFDVVVHQIRYGGMAGRAADERAALAASAIPDESVGPAALSCALRMAPELLATAARIARGSPGARVINLTNPLGISTALLRIGGVRDAIGICELPALTAARAARLCGVAPERLAWGYSGLNHRGFLHGLRVAGCDMIATIAASGAAFGGLAGAELAAFGALPTKYFRLFSRREPVSPPGRADALAALREAIASELDADPAAVPASLARRSQPWWEWSVVPLLHALASETPVAQVHTLAHADGIAREGWCAVSRAGAEWIGSPPPPPPAAAWVAAFEAHERAMLDAVRDPTPARLARVREADPLSRAAAPLAASAP